MALTLTSPAFAHLGRPIVAMAGIVFLTLAGSAQAADSSCHPDTPDCSCGKLPICIISGSSLGFYSHTWFDSSEKNNWEGFGEDEFDAHVAAMRAEIDMANALLKAAPCVEPIMMDAYQFATFMAMDKADELGLRDQYVAAKTAGNEARTAELQRQIDAIFKEYDVGDFPWHDPELGQVQLMQRILSCSLGKVEMKATTKYGGMTVSANVAAPMTAAKEENITGIQPTMEAAVASIAGDAAYLLKHWHAMLFSACKQVDAYCVTTNFDMGSQAWECKTTTTCTSDGRVLETATETGSGIRAGGGTKYVAGCCGQLDAVRNSEAPEDKEEREIINEIWCPGGWTFRAGDQDCDGVPNADDDTPWPPEHTP